MTAGPISTPTPAEDAFYYPADTYRHARTWLSWPGADKPGLQTAVAHLASVLSEFEPIVLVSPPGAEPSARDMCGAEVEIITLAHTSPRLRDTGPTFLVDGKGGAAAVDWRFSAWGGLAAPSPADDIFAHELLGRAEVRRFRAPLSLEPGAIVSDGADTLLALAPAVFGGARNLGLTRLEAFSVFQQWLSVTRVIWLEDAHPADRLGTDLRAVAAFIERGAVVASKAEADHPYAAVLAKIAAGLRKSHDAAGRSLEIIETPAPPVRQSTAVPLSYTSVLPVNGGLGSRLN